MKDRGKRAATERRNDDASFYYSTPSDLSCRKHPSVSAVGICPYCLNDRLVNLVCPECGEQRLSSCSCSDISPNRTSNAAVDAGNVVPISSFTHEEATKQRKKTEKSRKTEEVVVVFKRSSSSCVEISKRKQQNSFSKIGRFLRKINPIKERALDYNNDGEKQGVSRSLCGFRGGNDCVIGSEEDVSSYSDARSSFSPARSSSVNGGLGGFDTTAEHRKSNFEGRKSNFSETTETRRSNFSESEPPRRSCFEGRKSNFSETEYPRRSNFSETEHSRRENNHPRRSNYEASAAARKSDSSAMSFTRRVLSVKESYFTGGDEETGFIELKFDSSGGVVVNDGVLKDGGGGSCRLTTKDLEVSGSRRSFKGWKWIFGHHHHQRE
ncbi:hypothetical protein Bca4012_060322 [Brassica carinata]|uniref:Uncharacterized protein n=1 Tax=Brassica carinata TaxID=52824 RepID=A0A8X7S8R6_BRACI|nr:hypothetical protein Bca52824_030636 [Brassica carinata]